MSTKKLIISKLIVCLFVALLLSTNSIFAFDDTSVLATAESQIQPRWSIVNDVEIALGSYNSKIDINIRISAPTGTTYSNGKIVLTKTSGSDIGEVKTWSGQSSSVPYFEFNDNSLYYTRGRYNVKITITATRNGVSETITQSKNITFS